MVLGISGTFSEIVLELSATGLDSGISEIVPSGDVLTATTQSVNTKNYIEKRKSLINLTSTYLHKFGCFFFRIVTWAESFFSG